MWGHFVQQLKKKKLLFLNQKGLCNLKINSWSTDRLVFSFFSIDATNSKGYGRMINDSSKPNCKVVVEQHEELKLAIYTITDIKKGLELRFDYNDKTVFWRKVSIL